MALFIYGSTLLPRSICTFCFISRCYSFTSTTNPRIFLRLLVGDTNLESIGSFIFNFWCGSLKTVDILFLGIPTSSKYFFVVREREGMVCGIYNPGCKDCKMLMLPYECVCVWGGSIMFNLNRRNTSDITKI